MISQKFLRCLPSRVHRNVEMSSMQLSFMIDGQRGDRLFVARGFEMEAAKHCSLSPSHLLWRGLMLQGPRFGSRKKFGRLIKEISCGQRSSLTARAICSIVPRNPTDAVSYSISDESWVSSVPGRTRHSATSASASGHSVLSVGKITQLPSEENATVDSNSTPFRKRKVAMWVGYVGTAFKGLQTIRGPDAANTIEYQLERAIYKAGGILETNYGHLDKLSWSRSSRTDKGVHSLSTVIAMKMEIPPWAWVGDPDGLVLADSINAHLPQTIQVFGILPVTKSFEARRFCCNRTYQYLLPASLIGLSEALSPEATGDVLQNFRAVLNTFEGRFAFHNYTIRKLYRTDTTKSKGSWGKHESRRRTPRVVKVIAAEEKIVDEVEVSDLPLEVPVVSKATSAALEHIMAYWLENPDPADKLSASHFRRILECSCGGLESFGGVQFIRISITGESFMVHQIRKMVATAVAVSRGVLPSDIIPLSLCRHARIVLPLAPADGLLLARNSFYPFRQLVAPAHERKFLESEVGVTRLKELPKLEITKRLSERVDSFWRDVLLPELAPQLEGSLPVWSNWLENLSKGSISASEMDSVRTSYTTWREESQLKMEAAEAEAEAAAAVVAGEVEHVLRDPLPQSDGS